MRTITRLLWAVAAAIGSGAYWLILGHLAFTMTRTDPVDMFTRGEFGGAAALTLLFWAVGAIAYAAIARAKLQFERSRWGHPGHG